VEGPLVVELSEDGSLLSYHPFRGEEAYTEWVGGEYNSLTPNPNSVVNGDSLPFVGPESHSVTPLKTPVAPVGEGNLSPDKNGEI